MVKGFPDQSSYDGLDIQTMLQECSKSRSEAAEPNLSEVSWASECAVTEAVCDCRYGGFYEDLLNL